MAFTISSDTSDDTLIAELHRLIRHERNATARVIAHLAEVERRRIHLAAGFPSMFAYFPQEDVPTCVRKVPIAQRSGTSIATAALPMTTTPEEAAPPPIPAPSVALPPSPPSPPRRAEIRALAAERYHVSFTASTATIEKLREAQDLLGHAVPSGDVAEVVERALDALLKQLHYRKFGETPCPREMDRIRLDDRYIPPAVKRAVWARDGGRCAFVGQPERRRELAYVHSPRDEWGSPYLSRTIRARLDR